MYNIIHARRPTDRRPEADARGRTPGHPSNACAQGAREARGYRFIRGATEVRGRVGLVTPQVGATRTASHERRARNLRSGLRRVWTQAQANQTASTVTTGKLLPMCPVCFVTYVGGCTIRFFLLFFRKRSHQLCPDTVAQGTTPLCQPGARRPRPPIAYLSNHPGAQCVSPFVRVVNRRAKRAKP